MPSYARAVTATIAVAFTFIVAASAVAADVIAFAMVPAAAADGGGPIQPGDVITKQNASKIDGLASEGVKWAVNNGMDMRIVPYERIPMPSAYLEASERYGDQTELGSHNELVGWVAGKPFPIVDENDPEAPVKIMYNFQNTHYFSDDLGLHLVDADTGSLYVDAGGNRRYAVERHFVSDWLRVLQFQGRLHHEPTPAFEDNADETFRKSGLYPLIEPFDLKGVGGVSYRYQDLLRHDDTWLYLPAVRRVRRMSSAQRSDALFGQDIDVDSYGGYAGQIPWFEWKLLGTKPMLASLHGENLPPKPCTKDGGMTFCENWELRPEVYVIEGTPKVSNYAYAKRLIYIDKETNFVVYSDLYDRSGELWKVVMQSIRTSKQPNPKVDYSYDEPRMFIYAFSVIDIQLMHGTRASIPGMAFPDEAGWYIDVGFDTARAADEDWFSVAGLVTAGR